MFDPTKETPDRIYIIKQAPEALGNCCFCHAPIRKVNGIERCDCDAPLAYGKPGSRDWATGERLVGR